MALRISIADLRAKVESIHFASQGDAFEQRYWPVFKERFPRIEEFWRWCVVPMTARIEQGSNNAADIAKRDVASDLWNISFRHYSAFCHFIYAYERLRQAYEPWAPVEFYSHLGSVCDLAEDFLIDVHLLVLACRHQSSTLLCKLPRVEFLELAAEWYDESYSAVHQHYLSKGKGMPLNLPSRKSLVREYLGRKDQGWKRYQDFARPLRAYRNFMVHDVALGEVRLGDGLRLVPKKQRLSEYKHLDQVLAAARDPERLKQDFIIAEEQMVSDFIELQSVLNVVWERPIQDLTGLLYEDRNETILKKYNIELSDGRSDQ